MQKIQVTVLVHGDVLFQSACYNRDMHAQPQNPLHGITLKTIVEYLFRTYGWEELSRLIKIKCFEMNPSITSSLTFLRKTPWAREKVERLYLNTLYREKRKSEK